jgi:hypothetical protein
MHLHTENLLRIILEEGALSDLRKILSDNSVFGYTVMNAKGIGMDDQPDAGDRKLKNRLMLEVILNSDRLDSLLMDLREFLAQTESILYVQDVKVLRREKFF